MSNRAYITIVRWPGAFSTQQKIHALVNALGMDPYQAELKAQQWVPQVLARVESDLAPDVVGRFRAAGVSAFALTQTYMTAQPKPILIKRFIPALGADEPMYMVEPWKGEPLGLRTRDIFLLVRAALDRTRTTVVIDRPNAGFRASAFGIGAPLDVPTAVRTHEHKLTHILDIYLQDGSRFRVNADRMSFDVLGKDRGYTDLENTDKLSLRLAREAPQAQVDTDFGKFKVPPDISRDLVTIFDTRTTSQRDETAVFDFYSIWTHVIHRGRSKKA